MLYLLFIPWLNVLGDDEWIIRGLSCTPNIYVSWSTSELRVRLALWNRFKTSSKYFTDRSKAVLLLWIIYVFLPCICYAFVLVCLNVSCGHLLGKGWSLGSRLWCLTVSLSLSHWYPGSGVVLDCIESWSLHPFLLSRYYSGFEKKIYLVTLFRNLSAPPKLDYSCVNSTKRRRSENQYREITTANWGLASTNQQFRSILTYFQK